MSNVVDKLPESVRKSLYSFGSYLARLCTCAISVVYHAVMWHVLRFVHWISTNRCQRSPGTEKWKAWCRQSKPVTRGRCCNQGHFCVEVSLLQRCVSLLHPGQAQGGVEGPCYARYLVRYLATPTATTPTQTWQTSIFYSHVPKIIQRQKWRPRLISWARPTKWSTSPSLYRCSADGYT